MKPWAKHRLLRDELLWRQHFIDQPIRNEAGAAWEIRNRGTKRWVEWYRDLAIRQASRR